MFPLGSDGLMWQLFLNDQIKRNACHVTLIIRSIVGAESAL